LCTILEYLAGAKDFEAALTATTLDFVRYDLTVHVIDEEEDLFPLLRRRCEPDDAIEDVLGRLSGEHATDQDQARAVRAVLETALADQIPVSRIPGAAATLRQFATHQRAHLALENAIVMPLARRRITGHDLEGMSKRLAARRGIVL
jgi:iron-sulfur cluster repair protein YtfE (RIC family)